MVAVSPFADADGHRPVIAGSDTAGFQVTTDDGASWAPANAGVSASQARAVASIVFSSVTPGAVWALVGRGESGMLLASSDFGRHWRIASVAPDVSASNQFSHPRPTGRLLAVVETAAGTRLWVASQTHGLMTSTDDGAGWHRITPPAFTDGAALRGLAINPRHPNTVWVATATGGLWRVDKATTSPVASQVPGGPTQVEELAIAGRRLYVAAGAAGMWVYDIARGTWSRGTAPPASFISVAVARRDTGDGPVIYAGGQGAIGRPDSRGIFVSRDRGETWVALMTPDRLDPRPVGQDSPWWLSAAVPQMMPDGVAYVAAQIAVDPGDHERLWVAGRSGLWTSGDAGQTWRPAVHRLGVTVNSDVVADPNVPGRVVVANTDWGTFVSSDNLDTIQRVGLPGGANTAYDIALDTSTTPSTVLVAGGNRDENTQGEVYWSSDPATSPYQTLGLAAATGGRRALAVATATVGGQRTVMAAVQQSGVWVRTGAGLWTQSATPGLVASATDKRVGLRWSADLATAYLYDAAGVWASSDAGATWSRGWSVPADETANGEIEVDGQQGAVLYVATNRALRRLVHEAGAPEHMMTATELVVTGGGSNIAALTRGSDGSLLAAAQPSADTPGGVFATHDSGQSFRPLCDQYCTAAGMSPSAVALASDGTVLLATIGSGVLRGVPSR